MFNFPNEIQNLARAILESEDAMKIPQDVVNDFILDTKHYSYSEREDIAAFLLILASRVVGMFGEQKSETVMMQLTALSVRLTERRKAPRARTIQPAASKPVAYAY